MRWYKLILIVLIIAVAGLFINLFINKTDNILSYTVDLSKQELKLYWNNEKGERIKNFKRLNDFVETKNKKLVFAMNGGMFKSDLSPQGLFIENGLVKAELDSIQNGYGNFYLMPNGVFYVTGNNIGVVCKTVDFDSKKVKYATQSGPMLLIDGKIHDKFTKGSKNLNIRNGVGILPNGNIVFAMSKEEINFYDFATWFKSKGCKNALYLDGFVSRTYLPQKGYDSLDGDFGVMIAVTEHKQ